MVFKESIISTLDLMSFQLKVHPIFTLYSIKKLLAFIRCYAALGTIMKKKLALTTSNSPKPFFAYARRRRELRMDVENVIVNGVELSQPAEMCEAFRKYFSSTFRKDEGNDPKLNY